MLNRHIYTSDILPGFEQLTINLPNDYEGKVVTTLVRKFYPFPSSKAVLYIHGFQDYFFQTELADRFIEHGYNFYAIDLRKSGRSLLSNQIPYNMRDINDFYADISAAVTQIKSEDNTELVINAHSTGGLIAALYLHKYKDACNALILNSPFLELNKKWSIRKIELPLLNLINRMFPKIKIKGTFSPFYGQSIYKGYHGEWDYNLEWKPISASYVTSSWISAIYRAHKQIKRKLKIQIPVLVMSSEQSIKNKEWTDGFKKADAVLNVKDIRKYAYYLGNNITTVSFKNGMHDLILSSKPIREKVYQTMFDWLDKIIR